MTKGYEQTISFRAENGSYHTFETSLKGGGYPGMVKDHTMTVPSREGLLKIDIQKLFAF